MNTSLSIQSVRFKEPELNKVYDIEISHNNLNETNLFLKVKDYNSTINELKIIITFSNKIVSWRTQNYNWAKNMNISHISNDHSPKILVLSNKTHVLSSKNIGAWEYNPKNKNELIWVLKSPLLTPVFKYQDNRKRNFINKFNPEDYKLKLLFSKKNVPEFSRSKLPFTPIICFTDHCDFDTNENLKKQISFFNKNNITVTKGFFTNHFSKRKDNSSFENDSELLSQFLNSKNELAYHSITQSIRDKVSSINEYKKFIPPSKKITTWIDHGYQPYNFTTKHNSGLTDKDWSNIIHSKGIKNLWNYLDTGTSNNSIINQLNPSQFTVNSALKTGDFKFLIRTLMFFNGDEKILFNYRKIATFTKNIIYKKQLKYFLNLVPVILSSLLFLIKSYVLHRNKPFKYSKYTPFIFKHQIGQYQFNIFQTLEVTNFETTFSQKNIELLCKDKGAIIAHCYFSSPYSYQKGKLFKKDKISDLNIVNFKNLKNLILSKQIWNPTLNELIEFHNENLSIEYYYNSSSNRIELKQNKINIRYIKHV